MKQNPKALLTPILLGTTLSLCSLYSKDPHKS